MRKAKTIREPIKLRSRKLKDGRESLYLDTYHDGKRATEWLHLHLLPGESKSQKVKTANAATLAEAIYIKQCRILEFIEGRPKEPLQQLIPTAGRELAKIRTRELTNGKKGLHLSIYQDGKTNRERLTPYLLPETSPEAKAHNEKVMAYAEQCKEQRTKELLEGRPKEPLPPPPPSIKPPQVRLYLRKCKRGRQSLYLTIYDNGKIKREFLKLYLLPETSPEVKARNKILMAYAEQCKEQRTKELQEGRPKEPLPPSPDPLEGATPIRIRTKPSTSGKEIIYFDIYHKGERKCIFPGLYLLPENTPEAEAHNAEAMEEAAETHVQLYLRLLAQINEQTKSQN